MKHIASQYLSQLKTAIDLIDPSKIEEISDVIFNAYKNGNTIYLVGNGGSASTSSHIAIDLSKGTLLNYYNKKESRLRVISLTDNVAAITAIANDLSYEDVFVEQLDNLIQEGDVVIGISGSGNSLNVIKALLHAKEKGAVTIGFLGFMKGGRAVDFTDYSIVIQSNHMGVIEDLHMSIGHVLTDCLAFLKKQEKSYLPNGEDKRTNKQRKSSSKHIFS